MSDKPPKGPEESKPFDIFISYARDDAEVAKRLVETLEHRGVRCWLDTSNLQAGTPWADQITDAIESCRNFVVVVSGSTVSSSPWVSTEWSKIQESVWRRQDASIFPVTVGPVELPPFLNQWHTFRLDEPTAPIEGITEAITERVSESKPEKDRTGGDAAITAERFREIERALTALQSKDEESSDG